MTLYPQDPRDVCAVPAETARVAHAALPRDHVYLRLKDEFGSLYDDTAFAPLFSARGRPAEAPWRLALVTLLQFAEGLSDRQAAEAVRSRIDWKYLLSLDLTNTGFDASVLCEFRGRLLAGSAEGQLFETLLDRCRERHFLKARGRQRTDSTHVLAAIRALNRLEGAGETMRRALNVLAVVAPDWLRQNSQPDWLDRYGPRLEDFRLPTSKEERHALAETYGADGLQLLAALDTAPAWLHEIPAIQLLRQVWEQQFEIQDGAARWRRGEGVAPASEYINSPYDPDARYSRKRTTSWVGYKVHLTETCDEDGPHLITQVETTPATMADGERLPTIHHALAQRDLLPKVHLADAGYVDAELLVTSRRDFDVELLGPTHGDIHWQAREAHGFDASCFRIDWEAQRATCPEGHTSISWTPAVDNRHAEVIKIKFSTTDCGACPSRAACTHSVRARRTLTIRPQDQYLALRAARQRQTTKAYATEYARRAGIEGTISQGVRSFGLRRARFVGLPKVHLQHLLTAAALNFVRVGLWLVGAPRATTRLSPFARLMTAVA
jgi:transposase